MTARRRVAKRIPIELAERIAEWLVGNAKTEGEVMHGLFPLGMVRRWIERALVAEHNVDKLMRARRTPADLEREAIARMLEERADSGAGLFNARLELGEMAAKIRARGLP